MIKKTIITTIVLLVIYNVFLLLLNDSLQIIPQSITQDNEIKVEEFLYRKDIADYIIVGSSMSAKLDMSKFNGFYNLAFRGQSIYDGFSIIKRRKDLPKTIFIEYNVLLRAPSKNSSKSEILTNITNSIKKVIPSQRTKNQPVNIAISYAYSLINRSENKLKSYEEFEEGRNDSCIVDETEVNIPNMDEINKEIKTEYKEIPSDSLLQQRLTILKAYVNYFKNKGVNLVFFETPNDIDVCNSPSHLLIRSVIHKNFPPEQFDYIKPAPCSNFKTKDGVHLTDASALRFSYYLVNKFEKLQQSYLNDRTYKHEVR